MRLRHLLLACGLALATLPVLAQDDGGSAPVPCECSDLAGMECPDGYVCELQVAGCGVCTTPPGSDGGEVEGDAGPGHGRTGPGRVKVAAPGCGCASATVVDAGLPLLALGLLAARRRRP